MQDKWYKCLKTNHTSKDKEWLAVQEISAMNHMFDLQNHVESGIKIIKIK